MDLYGLSACEMAREIKEGRCSCVAVVKSCLDRIDMMEPEVHAMISLWRDEAIVRAEELDKRLASGEDIGPLGGVPVVLKDNLCTEGHETTCASAILKGWKPPYNATVVKLLTNAGAIILGKSNLDEFAMGGSTESSVYGVTSNPWDLERVPGGSSGGSAAAVAAGYVPFSIGSDTGGSIRQPAAFCGIYGLKPTYGRVSRYGLAAFASSLDQVGPFARTVEDLAKIMEVIGVYDPMDSTSEDVAKCDFSSALSRADLKGKRIGVIEEIEEYDYDPRIKKALDDAVQACRDEGAEIVPISLATAIKYGLACYYILAPAEASSNLARYDGVRYGYSAKDANSVEDLYFKTRREGFGDEVKRRILTGTYVLSAGFYDAYYLKAQKVRKAIKEEFARAFDKVDSIVLPVSPTSAFKIGELVDDTMAMYMADVFTIPVNMAGLPGLAMNVGFSEEGLPLGVQFIGPKWGEEELLGTAAVMERRFGKAKIASREVK